MNKLDGYISDLFTSRRQSLARHLLLQLLILTISSSVLWNDGNRMPQQSQFVIWLVYFVTLDILVYVNIYLLAKPLLLKNRISAYVCSAVGLVAALIIIIGVLQSFMPGDPGEESSPWGVIGILSSVAAVGLLFAGTSTLILFRQWIISAHKRQELESLNFSTELQMLKNQINPHFLFNMLNNCYLLIKKGRKDAGEVLFRLEDLLRYQTEGGRKESVTLAGEINFLHNILSLEKLRRDNFIYRIEDRIGSPELQVPPMLFIPFVENAIKHNSDSERESFVKITFERWTKGIIFECVNSKPQTSPIPSGVGGLGLKNVKRRLGLLYPGRHELAISDGPESYRVTLKLVL